MNKEITEGTVTIGIRDFKYLERRSEEFQQFQMDLEMKLKRVSGFGLKELEDRYRASSAQDARAEINRMRFP